MQLLDNNTRVFLELVRAGLWEKEARILPFGRVDYGEVMSLAEGQSVVGIVTAGLEHIKDAKVPQEWVLQFSGKTILIEQRNMAMNKFIAMFVDKMRKKDICILLIKGQGVAQCYERPLWRTSGDVDFLMSDDYYVKAKEFLTDISSCQKSEGRYSKHLGL